MKDFDLYIKFLKECGQFESITELNCRKVESLRDRIRYTDTTIKGFNKNPLKFIIYFLNYFDYRYQMYLVTKQNKVIGCFALRNKGKKNVYLYDFTVLPIYRGKGYSREILNIIYNLVNDYGKNKLSLYLRRNNSIAYNLYISEGFKKVKSQK